MKNLSISLLIALSFSCVTFCGDSLGWDESEPNVISDEPIQTWVEPVACTYGFQFSALFLQPTTSTMSYAAEAVPLPVPSPHWIIHNIKPDYRFGFDLNFKLGLPQLDTNLIVNWTHFSSRDSASKTVSSKNMIGPFFEIGPDASAYKKARGTADFHFDEVNVRYGQYVDLSDRLQTNFFAGVSFARIKHINCSRFSNTENTIVRSINTPSRFVGAGPHVGIDFYYKIVNGLQFTGKTAASLLAGSLKNHTEFTATSPALAPLGITPPNKQSTSIAHRVQVVPAFEEKLGLSYCFTLCEDYFFNIEAGYQARVYLNAIQTTDVGSEVVTPPVIPDTVGVFARTFQRGVSNFALAGPYLSVSVEY